jgi:BolA protein
MKEVLINLINENLKPQHIAINNTSHRHIGHDGYNNNSHFEITVVSNKFKILTRLERHRLIFKILETEIQKIHSISLELYTEEEYEN